MDSGSWGRSAFPWIKLLGTAVVAIAVMAIAAAVTIPIICLVILSLRSELSLGLSGLSLANYYGLLSQPSAWRALENSIIFTLGGAFLAIALGSVMAWAVASVRLPFQGVLRFLPICVLILPPLVKDPAWVSLFSGSTGLVNIAWRSLTGLQTPLVDIFSMGGMIAVVGFFSAPLAYVVMLTPFESIDRSLFDASRMSGAGLATTLRTVVIPMVLPALMSATMLLVIMIASAFETPIIIGMPAGVPTLMSQSYQMVSTPDEGLNLAAAQGSLYVFLTAVMVLIYMMATRNEQRFVAISGRGHSRITIETPWLRYAMAAFVLTYVFLAFIAPLVLTILTSFTPFYSAVDGNPFGTLTLRNYRAVFGAKDVLSGIFNSAVVAALVSIGAVIAAGLLSIVALKTSSRFRRWCEFIGMAPVAIPALVYSVGLLLTVLSIPPLTQFAYGTKGLMMVAEVVVFLPIAMRVLSSTLIQVKDELLEASRMSGAGMLSTLRFVVVPIMRPAILYVAAVVFVFSYRELGAIVLLAPQNTPIVPNISFVFWVSGGYSMLAALNVITLLVPLIFIVVAAVGAKLGSRRPRAALRSPASLVPG